MRHRRLRSLLYSDLLGAGLLTLLACSLYLPLFFFNVAWFRPLASAIGVGSNLSKGQQSAERADKQTQAQPPQELLHCRC
jgi:hypothetical protein